MPDTTDPVDTILIAMPLRKAVSEGDDSGPMPVEGIASDEGLDLESEAVRASAWEDSLPYLESQGHFEDFNHKDILLGDIQKARLVAPEWVEERFGYRPTGRSLYLKGSVYAPNEEMLPEQVDALRKVRGTLLAGGRLGLSMVGQRVRSAAKVIGGQVAQVTDKVIASKCAITPHPINPRTLVAPVVFAKSLSEALAVEGEGQTVVVLCGGQPEAELAPAEADTPAETTAAPPANDPPEPVGSVLAKGLRDLAKALTTTCETDSAGMAGGDAIRESSLGNGAPRKRRRRRRKRRPELVDDDD